MDGEIESSTDEAGWTEYQKNGTQGPIQFIWGCLSIRRFDNTINVGNKLGIRREASRWYAVKIARGPLPLRILERLPLWIQSRFMGRARLTLVNKPKDVLENQGL